MKKLYIYLLIGFVFFFGFGMHVNADSLICKYEGQGTAKTSEDRYIKVNLYYNDTSENYYVSVTNDEYKENETGDKEVSPTYNGKIDSYIFYINNDIKSDPIFNVDYDNFKCPESVSVYGKGLKKYAVCFFNDESQRCKSKAIANSFNVSNYYGDFKGEKIESKEVSNLTNGQTCTASIPYTDKDKNEKELKLKYIYNGGSDLTIQYNCGNNDVFQDVTGNKGTTFGCNGQEFDFKNGTISSSNTNILISDRTEFNIAFIKFWDDKNGDCSELLNIDQTDKEGVSPLLLPNAQEECKSGGCSNSNPTGFVGLHDWTYGWSKFYDNDGVKDCDGLIGPNIMALINEILMYVKILIPVLLIGFGVADFVRAMFSSDEQAMAKAKNKFIKRLVMAAIIFIIPAIINLIFNSINGIWAHINNEACNIWK